MDGVVLLGAKFLAAVGKCEVTCVVNETLTPHLCVTTSHNTVEGLVNFRQRLFIRDMAEHHPCLSLFSSFFNHLPTKMENKLISNNMQFAFMHIYFYFSSKFHSVSNSTNDAE